MIRCQNFIVSVNVQSVHHQLQAPTRAFSRLLFHSLVDRYMWQVAPNNLKCCLDFGDCFRHCFKLGLSPQHCTPHAIVHWVYIGGQWFFVMKSG